jgi:hypothetical protein
MKVRAFNIGAFVWVKLYGQVITGQIMSRGWRGYLIEYDVQDGSQTFVNYKWVWSWRLSPQ